MVYHLEQIHLFAPKPQNLFKIDKVQAYRGFQPSPPLEGYAKAVPIDIDDDLHLDFEDLKKINNKTNSFIRSFGGMLKDLTKQNYLDKKNMSH